MDGSSSNSSDLDASAKNGDLNRLAIEAALKCNWEEAVSLNKRIIEECPNDTACLNRWARALSELGKYQQAKKLYQEVLSIDPYNVIAQKSLKRIASVKKDTGQNHLNYSVTQVISPALFLEEAGVTKVVTLLKVAEPQKLSRLYSGALVNLVVKNHSVTVMDMEENYLGVLPDDISYQLIKLIKGGNKYQALIKSVKPNGLTILIRETFRSSKFRNQPSFLDSSQTVSYSSDHIKLTYDETISDVSEQDSEEMQS